MNVKLFKCNSCNKEFKYNSLYLKHINRKKPCNSDDNENNIIEDCIDIKKETFNCNNCNKIFMYKSLYLKHINRKNPCNIDIIFNDTNNQDINEFKRLYTNITQMINDKYNKSSDLKCYFCEHTFTTKGNLVNHKKNNSCKQYKELLDKQQKYKNSINDIKKNDEIKILKDKIIKLTNNKTTNINVNNIDNSIDNSINVTNNNQLHIHINNYGKEDISHITNNQFKEYIKDMYTGLINLIKHIHCNKDKPENYNIYLTNLRSKYIKIFKDDAWFFDDLNDVIEQLKYDKIDILDDKAKEFNDAKLTSTLQTFKGRLNTNAEASKNLSDNIKLVLYNNHESAIEHKNKLRKKIK